VDSVSRRLRVEAGTYASERRIESRPPGPGFFILARAQKRDSQEIRVKSRFYVSALFVTLLLALACSDGGQETLQAGAQFPLRIQQNDGQMLMLERAPSRIVSLSPAATEVFCAIGAGDSLVAVDKFANCPLGSKAKPEVDSFQPSLEALAAFRADLVYVFSDQGGIVAALRGLGTPVLFLKPPESLAGVFENIELLGSITGRSTQARDLVAAMQKKRDAITAKVANVTKGPRAFHELSPDYYTIRPDTFTGELYTLLKAENVAAGAPTAFPQLSAEVIIARDPEVIVLVDGTKPAEVGSRPGWANISAVRNNRLCEIDPDLLSRPGPRIVDGLEALSACLYPGGG
jgi:iron complex transport system substrate-binding protein